MRNSESSATLMEVASLNPNQFAKLKGSERKAAHAALLALLAQVSDGDESANYMKRSRQVYASVGTEAA